MKNQLPKYIVVIGMILGLCGCGTSYVDLRSKGKNGDEGSAALTGSDVPAQAAAATVKKHNLPVVGGAKMSTLFKQRNSRNEADFSFTMPDTPFDHAEAALFRGGKIKGGWFAVSAKAGKDFSTKIPTGNNYEMVVHLYRNGTLVGKATSIGLVVGDIFIAAGQSNSANAGDGKTSARSGGAYMFTGSDWQIARDPFKTADTTTGSSPWPNFGDFYYNGTGVPAAVVSLGWSGTGIKQWQKSDPSQLYARLEAYIKVFGRKGFRAVLWHQGESDVFYGTKDYDYRAKLQTLIAGMRNSVNWGSMPWFIARTSYIGVQGWYDLCAQLGGYPACASTILSRQKSVVAGQTSTVDYTYNVFHGANTDELWSSTYRAYQNNYYIHFNELGQYHHGYRWFKALEGKLPAL